MTKPNTIVQGNFGQHGPALEELKKLIERTTKWRDTTEKSVEEQRARLKGDEERLAKLNKELASYAHAIHVLGGGQ